MTWSTPRFEVSTTMVLRKSTWRPLASVSRPSSMICSRTMQRSGVGFLHVVEEDDGVGVAANGLGEPAGFVEPDVARRGADQPRDAVVLRHLRHVDPHQVFVGAADELGQGLGGLGFADA